MILLIIVIVLCGVIIPANIAYTAHCDRKSAELRKESRENVDE